MRDDSSTPCSDAACAGGAAAQTDAELAEIEVSIANELGVGMDDCSVAFTEAVQKKIDEIEAALLAGIGCNALVDTGKNIRHVFTPGLYAREMSPPRGSVIISKIHKTEHLFVMSKGVIRIFIEGRGWETISAPYLGVTKPMTRRLALVVEDCVWTTFHATDKKTPEEVEADIILPRNLLTQEAQCLS